jgi:hypothetical protein
VPDLAVLDLDLDLVTGAVVQPVGLGLVVAFGQRSVL